MRPTKIVTAEKGGWEQEKLGLGTEACANGRLFAGAQL
jgi:hypothetical protein